MQRFTGITTPQAAMRSTQGGGGLHASMALAPAESVWQSRPTKAPREAPSNAKRANQYSRAPEEGGVGEHRMVLEAPSLAGPKNVCLALGPPGKLRLPHIVQPSSARPWACPISRCPLADRQYFWCPNVAEQCVVLLQRECGGPWFVARSKRLDGARNMRCAGAAQLGWYAHEALDRVFPVNFQPWHAE